MFDLGKTIKQHLLDDTDVSEQIGDKIYNVVVYTTDKTVSPPYLVVDVDSISPVYTKDMFIYNEASFTIAILAKKYTEITDYSEIIRISLENKEIETDTMEIVGISFDNYSEWFDSNFELYNNSLKFSCKYLNK